MMLNPMVTVALRKVQFIRRASVESEKSSVHQILRVIVTAIAIERRHAAMRTAHRRIARIQLRLLA